jgi:hypothetical protein
MYDMYDKPITCEITRADVPFVSKAIPYVAVYVTYRNTHEFLKISAPFLTSMQYLT